MDITTSLPFYFNRGVQYPMNGGNPVYYFNNSEVYGAGTRPNIGRSGFNDFIYLNNNFNGHNVYDYGHQGNNRRILTQEERDRLFYERNYNPHQFYGYFPYVNLRENTNPTANEETVRPNRSNGRNKRKNNQSNIRNNNRNQRPNQNEEIIEPVVQENREAVVVPNRRENRVNIQVRNVERHVPNNIPIRQRQLSEEEFKSFKNLRTKIIKCLSKTTELNRLFRKGLNIREPKFIEDRYKEKFKEEVLKLEKMVYLNILAEREKLTSDLYLDTLESTLDEDSKKMAYIQGIKYFRDRHGASIRPWRMNAPLTIVFIKVLGWKNCKLCKGLDKTSMDSTKEAANVWKGLNDPEEVVQSKIRNFRVPRGHLRNVQQDLPREEQNPNQTVVNQQREVVENLINNSPFPFTDSSIGNSTLVQDDVAPIEDLQEDVYQSISSSSESDVEYVVPRGRRGYRGRRGASSRRS